LRVEVQRHAGMGTQLRAIRVIKPLRWFKLVRCPTPPAPYTLHPPCLTPYTLQPNCYSLHPTAHNPHPTPYTLHPTPFTPNPTLYILDLPLRPQHSILGFQPSTPTPQRNLRVMKLAKGGFVLNLLMDHFEITPKTGKDAITSTLNPQPSTLNPQPSTLNPQLAHGLLRNHPQTEQGLGSGG
jgi:hypothetical protein